MSGRECAEADLVRGETDAFLTKNDDLFWRLLDSPRNIGDMHCIFDQNFRLDQHHKTQLG